MSFIKYLLLLVPMLLLGGILVVRPIVVETYRFPEDSGPGWMVVEFDRPACPPLEVSWFSQTIEIPASRYACTSSPQQRRWILDRYMTMDVNGKPTKRSKDQWIHVRHSTLINGTKCQLTATSFWYGSEHDIHGSEMEIIHMNRPECGG